jgi:phage terminase large subunit-like protein
MDRPPLDLRPTQTPGGGFIIPAHLIKSSPLRVKQYVHPWYQPRQYIRVIEEKILAAKLAPKDSKVKRRFAIRIPPRGGKTEYISKALTSYFLANWPDEEVILISYNARKALNYSSKVREMFVNPRFASLFGVALKQDTRSKERWEIEGHRGGLTAAGFGGAITGEGANDIVIDDPFKNHEEAFSAAVRESRWNEFNSTVMNRVNDEYAIIILVGYSWHPDDLFGRIKRNEIEQETPEHLRFEFIDFPAIGPDGKVLADYPFSLEHLEQKKRESEVMFSAQYMMNPLSDSAYKFTRDGLVIIDELPFVVDDQGNKKPVIPLRQVRYYDWAFKTKEASDFSATARLNKYESRSVAMSIEWWKSSVPETIARVKANAKADGPDVWIGGESNTGQDAIIQALQADPELSGYTIIGIPTVADKQVRAMPWILRAQSGILQFLLGTWNNKFFSVAEQFGVIEGIKDPIDALSGAWQMAGDPIGGGYF